MTGTIVQLAISPGGVPARPVSEAVLTVEGFAGDSFVHPDIHGGPRQAVLLLSTESIEELKALGYPLFPGALGENLTVDGIDRRRVRVGQRYRTGDVVIEITKPRKPCSTLNPYGPGIQKAVYDQKVQAGDPSSPKWGLAGFFASVAKAGTVVSGSSISLVGPAD